jgi:hypothetical protein
MTGPGAPSPGATGLKAGRPILEVTGKRGNLQSGSAGLDANERQPAVRLPVGASPVQGCRPARMKIARKKATAANQRSSRVIIAARAKLGRSGRSREGRSWGCQAV